MSNDQPWQGRCLIVAAAALWSTSGFFAKSPWFDGWDADSRGLLLAFFRSLFAVLLMVPLIRRPEFRWPMVMMAVCFAAMVWSFMTAMVHGPAANAIWLQYLSPAWVLVGSVVILKERPLWADVRMFVFCLTGVGIILAMELRQASTLYASMMGVFSGLMFAGVLLSMRALRDADPVWLITINHAATVLLLLPSAYQSHQPIETGAYLALGMFGLLQMSVPYLLFARGLRTAPAAEAALLGLIEPLLVPVWVFVAWHHHPSYLPVPWWTWVGAGFILVGLVQRYAKLR